MAQRDFQVVYLLGIMARSGTNFLRDAICLHPDIDSIQGITEAFLFANSHHLERFVESVYQSWDKLWGDFDEELKIPLYQALGLGLETFLYTMMDAPYVIDFGSVEGRAESPDKRAKICLARTPSVANLNLIPRFTNSKVIVIVRDGRAVVESGMRSFGWYFDDSVHQWAKSADLILETVPKHPQMLLVRYEDLVHDQAVQMRRIFTFLGVDADAYDYQAVLPVRGSSTFYSENKGINWEETKKTADFDPLNRWRGWSTRKLERFNWIAGDQSRKLGYEVRADGNPVWRIYNLGMDLYLPLWRQMRKLARKVLPKDLRDKILWNRGIRYRKTVRGKG